MHSDLGRKGKTHLKILAPFLHNISSLSARVNQSVSAKSKYFNRIKQLCDTFPPCVSDPETVHQWQYTQGTWTFSWGSPKKKQDQHDTSHTVKPQTQFLWQSDIRQELFSACNVSKFSSGKLQWWRGVLLCPTSFISTTPPDSATVCSRVNVGVCRGEWKKQRWRGWVFPEETCGRWRRRGWGYRRKEMCRLWCDGRVCMSPGELRKTYVGRECRWLTPR